MLAIVLVLGRLPFFNQLPWQVAGLRPQGSGGDMTPVVKALKDASQAMEVAGSLQTLTRRLTRSVPLAAGRGQPDGFGRRRAAEAGEGAGARQDGQAEEFGRAEDGRADGDGPAEGGGPAEDGRAEDGPA